jgi:hypothetical protein
VAFEVDDPAEVLIRIEGSGDEMFEEMEGACSLTPGAGAAGGVVA